MSRPPAREQPGDRRAQPPCRPFLPPVVFWACAYVTGVAAGAGLALWGGASMARCGALIQQIGAPGAFLAGAAAVMFGARAARTVSSTPAERTPPSLSTTRTQPGSSTESRPKAGRAPLFAACLVALVAGAWRGTQAARETLEAGAAASRMHAHRGIVCADPRHNRYGTELVVRLDRPRTKVRLLAAPRREGEGVAASGKMAELGLGSRIAFVETLEALDPREDRVRPLLLEGVSARGWVESAALRVDEPGGLAGLVYRWRRALLARWRRRGRLPTARALVAAMVLGYRTDIDEPTVGEFRRSGLAHLLAVSGTHASVVAALVMGAMALGGAGAASRRAATFLALAVYALATGFQPSVLRVCTALGVMLAAWWSGRSVAKTGVVALGAAGLAAVWPNTVFSAGYQLSFLAAAGLVMWGSALSARLARFDPHVAGVVGASVAAQLGAMPLLAADFSQVSVVAPVANLVGWPAVVPLLATGLIGAVLGGVPKPLSCIATPAGDMLLAVADGCAAWVAAAARVCASSSWAAVATRGVPGAFWPLYYLLVERLVRGPVRSSGRGSGEVPMPAGRRPADPLAADAGRWRLPPVVSAACLALVLMAVFAGTCGFGGIGGTGLQPPAAVEMRVLDVGQGDAILLRTAGRHAVLVDGGPSGPVLKRRLAEAGVGRIDLAVCTHAHHDHYEGLIAAISDLSVRELWRSPGGASEPGYERMLQAARRRSVRVRAPPAGVAVQVDRFLALEVLWPPAESVSASAPTLARPFPTAQQPTIRLAELTTNDQSLVIMARSGRVRFLLSGDIGERAQGALAGRAEALRCDVYKVAHHGSAGSLQPDFLSATGARLAVISVGRGNRHGHPTRRALRELAARGMRIARTDEQRTLILTTDGRMLGFRASGILGP